MSVSLDFRNVNALWGSIMVETLSRLGLRTIVISPGSRSAPLTMAFARHPVIESIPVLDERSAAFFALGLAKQQHGPVALLCTSGTAGAHYFPAIIEAQESGVPLLVITADRPPEMRDASSGQTIDQQKLFGSHVNFYHEFAVPAATLPMLSYLRQTVAHAWIRAHIPAPGPVHLNAPFRDPLVPLADGTTNEVEGVIDDSFFSHLDATLPAASSSIIWQRPTTARGLIVAGPAAPRDRKSYAARVHRWSVDLGWPVLADALSPLRGSGSDNVVTTYDAVLRDSTTARELIPRTVLCLGGWPTSKILRSWLESSGAEILLVSSSGTNRDALHGRTRQIVGPVESLAVVGERIPDDSYLQQWMRAEAAARSSFDEALEREPALFEGKACWLLARHLPAGTDVFVANSMPVRDVEYFWPADRSGRCIYCSRGANGIDGTLSTALGLAHGAAPLVVLTGDLALLHDANGFLIRPKFRGSLTVVLINNRGGGIFEHLPVATHESFENYFATPQEVDFGKLCEAHQVPHVLVRDWDHFSELVRPPPPAGIRVWEVRTDRKRDAAIRQGLFAAVARAARAAG